jgi:S-adenosylmethionine decarboxylase
MHQRSQPAGASKGNAKCPTITFGKHLTIDAYGCNEKTLNDMEANFKVLNELPGKIAMHTITTPYVIKVGGNNKKDCGGVSGFVMIAESHIALHTFPAKKYLTMDIYSCTMFSEKIALDYLKNIYQYKKLEKHVIKRGLEFPKNNLVEI